MNKQQTLHRIPWIDVLRGIAILLMIPANFSIYFSEPHSLSYRILSSYAAPTFIMVSAGMVIFTGKRHNLFYYLLRGFIVMSIDAVQEIFLEGIFPFTTGSVLYLIGMAIPIIFIMRKFRTEVLIVFGLIFFVLTPLLQNLFGYHAEVLGVHFNDIYWPGISRILLSWFVDGWFPIFPWLGYAFFGAVFFRIIFSNEIQNIPLFWVILGVVAVVIGFIFLFLPVDWLTNINHGILKTREGYTEIFYPPTLPYMLSSLGVFILLAWLAQQIYNITLGQIISLFGKFSMLVYLLHEFFADIVISPIMGLFGTETVDSPILFTVIVLVTMAVLYLICRIVEYSKKFWTPSGAILQVLFGK